MWISPIQWTLSFITSQSLFEIDEVSQIITWNIYSHKNYGKETRCGNYKNFVKATFLLEKLISLNISRVWVIMFRYLQMPQKDSTKVNSIDSIFQKLSIIAVVHLRWFPFLKVRLLCNLLLLRLRYLETISQFWSRRLSCSHS